MGSDKLKTVEECKKIAAEILGVDEKDLVQFGFGDFYGFHIPNDYSVRDIVIDPRTGEEVSIACQ